MLDVTNEIFETALADVNNTRIISNVCRVFRKQMSKEELMYCGQMALFKCLRKHNPKSNNKFTTSLHRYTMWQCLHFIRDEIRYNSAPLPTDLKKDYKSYLEVHDCLDNISKNHREILKKYYFSGMNFREIGIEEGYSYVAAWQKLQQAKYAFRRLYEEV